MLSIFTLQSSYYFHKTFTQGALNYEKILFA